MLALFPVEFIQPSIKVVRTKEIVAQHLKGISGKFNIVLLEMLNKKLPYDLAAFATRFAIMVIERFWMLSFQQIVEPAPIRIRKADEPSRRVHARCRGEVSIGTVLAKVSLFGSWLMPFGGRVKGLRQVNCRLPFVTSLAEHALTTNALKTTLRQKPPMEE
ncbi:MAG TPA: hypothetical protein VFE51_13725 [Verrucomicrobiae bacterium]|nr:hypothetical protein [Verrucomicrobiae bacterium]